MVFIKSTSMLTGLINLIFLLLFHFRGKMIAVPTSLLEKNNSTLEKSVIFLVLFRYHNSCSKVSQENIIMQEASEVSTPSGSCEEILRNQRTGILITYIWTNRTLDEGGIKMVITFQFLRAVQSLRRSVAREKVSGVKRTILKSC